MYSGNAGKLKATMKVSVLSISLLVFQVNCSCLIPCDAHLDLGSSVSIRIMSWHVPTPLLELRVVCNSRMSQPTIFYLLQEKVHLMRGSVVGNRESKLPVTSWAGEGARIGKEGKGNEMQSREERRDKDCISLGSHVHHTSTNKRIVSHLRVEGST